MPPSLFYLFVIITVGSILGSPTTKDVNHDDLALSAVAAADPTMEIHIGLVHNNCKTNLRSRGCDIKKLRVQDVIEQGKNET